MFQNMIPVLSQIDTRLLIGLSAIAVVLFIVSLVKKAIKAGITLLIVAMLLCGGIPTVNSLKESYGISYSKVDEVLELRMNGKTFLLPIKELKEAKDYKITLERGGKSTKVHLTYQRKDGTTISATGSSATTIPNYMVDTLIKYLTKNGLNYTDDSKAI